jgi:Transmembrane amino acid transporter protein
MAPGFNDGETEPLLTSSAPPRAVPGGQIGNRSQKPGSVNAEAELLVASVDAEEEEEGNRGIVEDRGTGGTFGSFWLILKSYVGSGLLGMPFAFLQGGILPGVATLIGVAIMSAVGIRYVGVVSPLPRLYRLYPPRAF